MCIVEIHSKVSNSFPNLSLKKQNKTNKDNYKGMNQGKQRRRLQFFVVALKRVVGNVLTMGCFISFLNFSFEVFL